MPDQDSTNQDRVDEDQRRYREQVQRTGAAIGADTSALPDELSDPTPEPAQTDHPAGEDQANENQENESPA